MQRLVGLDQEPRQVTVGSRSRWMPSALSIYAAAVGAVGVTVLLSIAAIDSPVGDFADKPLDLGVLGLALVASETKAIPLPRGDGTVAKITISTIFAMALVILGPPTSVRPTDAGRRTGGTPEVRARSPERGTISCGREPTRERRPRLRSAGENSRAASTVAMLFRS